MKFKNMKKLSFFLILLLLIPSLTGCFFKDDAEATNSQSLEIDYYVDGSNEDDEAAKDNSLLSQAREKLSIGDEEGNTSAEQTESQNTSDKEDEPSFWERLRLANEERNDSQEVNLVSEEDISNEKEVAEEAVKKNNFLQTSRELSEEKKEEGKQESNKKDNEEKEKEKEKESPKKEQDKDEKDDKPKESTVTITIRCDTAVAKGMDKDPEFAGIVPSSGVILSETTVKIKEGDTVLNVLEAITNKYKIQMRYTGSKESAYIEGINNLYEFDGGRWSGWMYCVNGWYPNYGAGVYVLQAGDVIEWNYTCDLGKDLGQEWLGN